MFAKLFARITESSLMEESIEVRYTFVMMLAIADPTGYVIGTDVAIARRLNIPLADFQRCAARLMEPDPNSNSKELEGRRLVHSEGERGYRIVNYLVYRSIRSEEERREYMATYMKEYRQRKQGVNSVNSGKPVLAKVEAEGEEDLDKKTASPWVLDFGVELPVELQTPQCLEAALLWLTHKKEKRQSYKPTGLKGAVTKWANEFTAANFPAAVENSIAQNYQGVFPVNQTVNSRPPKYAPNL